MCTDEKDTEELNEMYGRLCWQGYDKDHGGFEKMMWNGIMKEFNCKDTSAWSSCGREKEMAFTHRQHGDRRQECKAQLEYIIGPGVGPTKPTSTMTSKYGAHGPFPDEREDTGG